MSRLAEGALYERLLPDGREAVIYPLIMGTVRLVVGTEGSPFTDDEW